MPIYMPSDTRAVLGENAEKCDSRSLLMDRFADPAARDTGDRTPRRNWFNRLLAKSPVTAFPKAWVSQVPQAKMLYAQLQSRLMVNMAGGVMENAGLCLDRFGLPYIPGSAVKGCARRAALAALREWCETGDKPASENNLFNKACAPFAAPADMLAAIARVFGWCNQDWSDRQDPSNPSDFFWATNQDATVLQQAARNLAAHFRWKVEAKHEHIPWKSLPNFAGSISFLPAYPLNAAGVQLPLPIPPLGKLELDVVTCHHRNYYGEPTEPKDVPQSHEKWQRWKREHDAWQREWGTAPDTEEPVPVVFPAVAPGHVFAFALCKLRGADADVEQARAWLATGLEIYLRPRRQDQCRIWMV